LDRARAADLVQRIEAAVWAAGAEAACQGLSRPAKQSAAAGVRERAAEVIELADDDVLDLMRSRTREQEVLDMLDEPQLGDMGRADLGLAGKTRPVVIVSRFDPESSRTLVLYVPLTTLVKSI
jgi:hypothetical protein